MWCCTYFNLKEYNRFCHAGKRSCHSKSGWASEASRMGKAGEGLRLMVLSFHISPCAWLNAIKCPLAFITMSVYLEWFEVKAFTSLCTHDAPIMLSCVLSENRMTCPLFVIVLCFSWWCPTRKVRMMEHWLTCFCHLTQLWVTLTAWSRPEDGDKMSQHNW